MSTPVQLWLLPRDEDRLCALCQSGRELLSAAERARVERTTSPAQARRFLLGRVLMRRALAAHLQVAPASLVIVPDAQGKPALLEPAHSRLAFNLSSSRREWAFALAAGDGLGIDLEPLDRTRSIVRIARAFYSTAERQRLTRAGGHVAAAALQLWTLKEAVVKALGATVWQGLQEVRLALERDCIAWLAAPPDGDAARWSLTVGRLRGDHCLALALRSSAGPATDLAPSCRVLDAEDGPRARLFEPLLTSHPHRDWQRADGGRPSCTISRG